MYICSCPSSKTLAEQVAKETGSLFGNVEISKFANDEIRLRVHDAKIGSTAVVIQSLASPVDTNLIEFCFLCDAVHRMGVRNLTAVVPWLGYSKQDKVFRSGEPLSVKVIAKILQVAPIQQLITFDLHNLAILGFFDIPVTNLTARPLFVDYFKKRITKNTVIVAPDAGSIKQSTSFAGELDVPVVYMDKKRDLATGEVHVLGISRPIDHADVIIIDDMIVTGSTLVETAKFLREQHVESLSVAATHHLYVPGAQDAVEKSGFDEVIVTDTIAPKTESKKLKIVSTASLIAEELRKSDPE